MTSPAEKLRRVATRLKDQKALKKRSPPGTNLLDEEISVSPHEYPGITTQTLGGPEQKKKFRQPPMIEGPRGIACSEDGAKMPKSTSARLSRVAKTLSAMRRVTAAVDLKELTEKVARINAAIQSGKLPPEKMQQAAAMLAQLTMQMAQLVTRSQSAQSAA